MKSIIGLIFSATSLLSACDGSGKPTGLPVPEAPAHAVDAAQLALGNKLFQEHCAQCHRTDASGDPNWRKRGADGRFPPPPLNGSGHAWHHSVPVLMSVIKQGSPQGKGNMPAWEGKLTDDEIQAIITWFQSTWPKPVYDTWYEMQQRDT